MNNKLQSVLAIATLTFFSKQSLAAERVSSIGVSHTEIFRLCGGLLAVLVLIVLLSWLVKRLNLVQINAAPGFQVISTLVLGPKEKILLLQVDARYLLLGVTAGSINLLHDFGNTLPQGFELGVKPSFSQLLKSVVVKP